MGLLEGEEGLCPRTEGPGLGELLEHDHVWSIITPSKQ